MTMHPQSYLQQHQQPGGISAPPSGGAGADDGRSTSPTVVVTTSQVIKQGVDSANPSPSTAPNSSANTTPLSGAGAAAVAYASVPNPVHSYFHRFPENPQQQAGVMATTMECIDGGAGPVAAAAARPATPSVMLSCHSHPGSRDPLSSPMSAPPLVGAGGGWNSSAPPSTDTTPVPSEIHTHHQVGGGSAAGSRGPVPFFPSVLRNSASSNSISSSKGGSTSTKSVQVTGRKKHSIKASASATSLSSNNPDDSEVFMTTENGTGGAVVVVTARRQKRLERNRESARLSRRRRKQYLEVLEERVSHLSLEMDKGRRDHANRAIATICHKRSQVLEQATAELQSHLQQQQQQNHANSNLDHSLWLLEEGPLSRTSSALLVLSTFFTQQLKSFSLPSEFKFTLWLTLQGDVYFRGGRAASERLSAARIGERMLSNGNDKVTPTNSMWPLVCNEVGLSYDQEERVRQYQRTLILQDPNTWLDRHTAWASSLTMQSFHDAVGAMSNVLGQRERSLKQILTPEQRLKFLAWAAKNADRAKSKFQGKRQEEEYRRSAMMDSDEVDPADTRDDGDKENAKYQLDNGHHLAANLYILNHRLQNVLKEFPFHPPFLVTPTSLKKLSRRPSFESLGQQKDAEGFGLSRDTSFASMASLKASTSNLSLGGSSAENLEKMAQGNQITPEDGEQAAASTVDEVLGFVKPIIPPIPPPRMTAPPPVHPVPSNHATTHYVPTSAPSLASQQPAAPVTYVHYAPPSAPVLAAAPPQQYTGVPQYQGQQVIQYHQPPPATAQAPPPPQAYTYEQQAYQQPPAPYYPPPEVAAQAQPAPAPYALQPPPPGYTPVPSPLDNLPPAGTTAPAQQLSASTGHLRKSSFLPPHLNVVPEDMFPAGDTAAEDFFVGLMDDEEDWAIGEGIDMDTTI